MRRKRKLNADEQQRRDAMKATKAEYTGTMSTIKRFLSGLLGKKDATSVMDRIEKQIREGHSEIEWTAQGVPKIITKSHPPVDKVQQAGESLRKAVQRVSDELFEGRFIEDFMEKPAKAVAKGYINRRIDASRKAFGDDSAYIDDLQDRLRAAGMSLTDLGRVRGKSNPTVKQIFDALKEVKPVEREVAEAITDIAGKLNEEDLKKHVKQAMKSPQTMGSIGSYLVASRSESEDYGEVLKALYSVRPGDETSASGMDFMDLLEELGHPGRELTYSEIEENIAKITDYLKGVLL